MNFDIAIVGGGIAGLSAAREISQNCMANIVIIEEDNEIGLPASSSAFTFTDTVDEYALNRAVDKYYTSVGLYSFLGSKAIFELGGPKLAVLDPSRACKEMLLRSNKRHIEIFNGTRAVGLERKEGKVVVDLSGVNEGSIRCDLLIDTSGASFFSSRFVPFRIPEFYSQPFGYELDNCDIPASYLDEISFFVGRSIGTGGGWFYPITKSICRFGVAEITETPIPPIAKLKAYYDFAARNMEPFSEMITEATPRTKEAGTIPAEPMKDLVLDNIMRVGDSSGHATPHMLEGLRPAIESATLCGKIATKAYEKGDFSERMLEEYEKIWHRHNKLSYLYLLSMAEIFFSYDDHRIEKSIKLQRRRRVDPESYLRGLKGAIKFPLNLVTLEPSIENLKILVRFVYHNLRWILE